MKDFVSNALLIVCRIYLDCDFSLSFFVFFCFLNSLHYLRCVENVQTASGDTAKMSLAGVRPVVKLDGVVDPVKSSVNPIKSSLMDPTCKYDIRLMAHF